MIIDVRGVPSPHILRGLSDAERIGALAENYRGGDFVVHVSRYEPGSLSKYPEPDGFITRYLIKRGGGPYEWSWQANYGGAFVASTGYNRGEAIQLAREAIDEMIMEHQQHLRNKEISK